MGKLVVKSFAVSLDGFGAGSRQGLETPLGERGPELMEWFFATDTWKRMHDIEGGGEKGVDDRIASQGFDNVGAWILGRNMFGPVRGPWPDENWKGWWGDEPPYHVPAFVLTHHARKPIEMKGGTTFHFITGGIEEALAKAKAAAGSKDVRLGGGVSTLRQFFKARLIDEAHFAMRPVLLGEGESLLRDLDLRALGYVVDRHEIGERALHVFVRKS